MSNHLEKFISEKRNEFDSGIPSSKIWNQLDAAFSDPKKKEVTHFTFFKWSMAAAAILIVGSFLYLELRKKESVETAVVKSGNDINTLAPDDAPQVNKFAAMIDMKQEELKLLAKEQPVLYQKFTKDITQLDSSYNALQIQLSITSNREILLEAMIQNLQLQLNVLNQQLNIIHQIKQSKKESHEKKYQAI